jgi:hypothetical protein
MLFYKSELKLWTIIGINKDTGYTLFIKIANSAPQSKQIIKKTYFCIGESSTRTMNSDLDGMFLSTSDLSRRSRWHPRRSCSFFTCSSLEMSANSSRKPWRSLQGQGHTQGQAILTVENWSIGLWQHSKWNICRKFLDKQSMLFRPIYVLGFAQDKILRPHLK